MTTAKVQGLALLGMFAAMLLLSWGTASSLPVATAVGGAVLMAAAASLTVLRFAHPETDEDD